MAVRLIIAWLVLTAIFGAVAWLLSRGSPRALWARTVVAAALLAGCGAAFWMYGDHLDKTLGAVLGYFLLWGTVFGLSALCGGVVIGTLIALMVG